MARDMLVSLQVILKLFEIVVQNILGFTKHASIDA